MRHRRWRPKHMGSRRSGDRAPDERLSVAIFPFAPHHGRAGANEQHTPLGCGHLKRPDFVCLHGPAKEFATPGLRDGRRPDALAERKPRPLPAEKSVSRPRWRGFPKHDLKKVSREFSLTALAEALGKCSPRSTRPVGHTRSCEGP
jgi:hypothetical protein